MNSFKVNVCMNIENIYFFAIPFIKRFHLHQLRSNWSIQFVSVKNLIIFNELAVTAILFSK